MKELDVNDYLANIKKDNHLRLKAFQKRKEHAKK